MLYPKLYRVDDIQNNFKKMYKKKENVLKNIGLKKNDRPFVIKPYLYPLLTDSIEIDSAFIYDDGLYINLILTKEVDEKFINEVLMNINFFRRYSILRISKN